jgi:hypothetical protein
MLLKTHKLLIYKFRKNINVTKPFTCLRSAVINLYIFLYRHDDMASRIIIALIGLQLFAGPVSCARILAVFPCPSKSHLVVFTALTRELALRGHELVVVSPFPISNPPANYTDINIFPDMKDFFDEIMGEALYQMIDMWTFENALMFWMEGIQISETTLGNSEVKKLLNDRRGFDLVIVEDFMTEPLYAFASYFKVI